MRNVKFRDGNKVAVRSIWCLGRNYALHARELGNEVLTQPLVFQKGLNALHPLEGSVTLPRNRGTVHFETELIALVGNAADQNPAIIGLAVGLDLTLRDEQSVLKEKGHPWALAKSFDGAGIVGPFKPVSEFNDLDDIRFAMTLNGDLRQSGNTNHMMLPMTQLLDYFTNFTTLQSGDLIFTGTPEGIGELQPGDEAELSIEDVPQGRIRFS